MQKNKLFILLSGLCTSSYAQTITVRDQSSREPLEHVVIQDKNNVQVKTNIKGKADVSVLFFVFYILLVRRAKYRIKIRALAQLRMIYIFSGLRNRITHWVKCANI